MPPQVWYASAKASESLHTNEFRDVVLRHVSLCLSLAISSASERFFADCERNAVRRSPNSMWPLFEDHIEV